jgi:hypothetical protein
MKVNAHVKERGIQPECARIVLAYSKRGLTNCLTSSKKRLGFYFAAKFASQESHVSWGPKASLQKEIECFQRFNPVAD